MKLLKADSSENSENTRMVQGAASAAKDQHNIHVGVNRTAPAAMGLFPWPYDNYVQAKRPRLLNSFWNDRLLNSSDPSMKKGDQKNHKVLNWSDWSETLAVTHAQNTQIVAKDWRHFTKVESQGITGFNNYSRHFSDTEGAFVATVERNQNVHKRKEKNMEKNGTLGCPVIYTAAQLML